MHIFEIHAFILFRCSKFILLELPPIRSPPKGAFLHTFTHWTWPCLSPITYQWFLNLWHQYISSWKSNLVEIECFIRIHCIKYLCCRINFQPYMCNKKCIKFFLRYDSVISILPPSELMASGRNIHQVTISDDHLWTTNI